MQNGIGSNAVLHRVVDQRNRDDSVAQLAYVGGMTIARREIRDMLFDGFRDGLIVGELIRDAAGTVVDWCYLDVNAAWEQQVGVEPGAVVGRTVRALFPGIEDAWIDEVAKVVASCESVTFVRQVESIGRWFEGRAFPLSDDRFGIVFKDVTNQRQLDIEQLRLSTLVEQSGDFIGVAAPDGEILYVNSAGRALVGLDGLDAARATAIGDYFMPDEDDKIATVVLPSVRDHGYWDGELRFRHFVTGKAIPVLYTIFPVRDIAGTVSGYGTVTRDLRLLHSIENKRSALLALDEGLRDLIDPAELAAAAAATMAGALGAVRAGYGTVDRAAGTVEIVRDWSAAGIASLVGTYRFGDFGSFVDELIAGRDVLVNDVDADPRTAPRADAWASIATRAIINVPIVENGRTVAIFYVHHQHGHDWTREEIDFIRTVAERTRSAVERRRAEQALQTLADSLELQVEERTRELDRAWRYSQELQVIVDSDGVFEAVNPATTRLLGRDADAMIGCPLAEFLHPDDRAGAADLLRIAATEPTQPHLNRYRTRDDDYRWISWTTTPADGVIYCYGRDVTAEHEQAEVLARTEDALRQSQKMEAVGQLTGGLAHDFNNLLTGIMGNLELLQARIARGRLDDVDRFVLAAQGAGRRAASLTQRLLAFSRRQTLDPRPTDVNRLIGALDDLLRRTVGPTTDIEIVGAAGLWTALIDAGQLENAILNLCINGRDAMPDGGRLTIETANKWIDERTGRERDLDPGQYISICVTDTGTGMDAETIERAFEPFYTTKPIGQGTGLGLSMIYGFARQSGGQVRIYSEMGTGTTICIYLPRHAGDADTLDEEHAIEAASAATGQTILVVDDEPTIRHLIDEVLDEQGYTVIGAADGAAGLKVLQSGAKIELLITDVGLPGGMNGRQVADAARALRAGLKILFITGYAENAAVGNGHLEPGMELLTKPFSMDALSSKVAALLRS